MFTLPPRERNDVYTPVPNDWDCESTCALEVFTSTMFSNLDDHLPMLVWIAPEHLGHMAEV